jgi:hypothetical protein
VRMTTGRINQVANLKQTNQRYKKP